MELVDCEGAADEAGSENRGIDGDEFPHGRVVVREHLQLRVQVAVQVHEARERRRRMSTRHALQAIVDLVLVARADAAVEHDLAVAVCDVALRDHVGGDDGLADCEEVGAQTADKPFDEDLEDGGGDEGVEEADGGIVDVPEGAHADLADEEDSEGDEEGHEGRGPDGDDLITEGVGELRVDDLAVGEDDWMDVSVCSDCTPCGFQIPYRT